MALLSMLGVCTLQRCRRDGSSGEDAEQGLVQGRGWTHEAVLGGLG